MKQSLLIIVYLFFSLAINAQNQIEICQNKTTHLIAKEKITYVQVGDPDKLIAEVVPEQTNSSVSEWTPCHHRSPRHS